MKQKEYLISDPEVLKQNVYDCIVEGVSSEIERFESAGMKVTTASAYEGVVFTVTRKHDSFTFCVSFVSDGENGGYYVSPALKRGTAISKVCELMEKIFAKLRDDGFAAAKAEYDGLKRDYSQEKDKLAWLMPLIFVSVALLLACAVAATVYVIS